MLRISKLTDYATVVLSYMARSPLDIYSAAKISERLDIGQPTVSKILKLLAHGNLLSAQRGVNGGYTLARPPQRISVAEIIDAMEGIPVGLTECSSVPGVCAQERGCAIRGNWQKISLAVRGALEGVTLADLVLPPPGAVPLLRMDGPPANDATGARR
jgi:FeS assembly SUF system regulator